jgi:DNA-directed RNA polymerase subunit RPC12/RpoP
VALIKCPECGKEISDKATECPNCGYPIAGMKTSGIVRIKMPNNIVVGWVGLFSSRDATIYDENDEVLWEGQHGDNAKFEISHPMNIRINLGGWANEITGRVEPQKKYSLVQDMGVHMLATFRLTEVDIIDAD